jgi:hypothetical protein
VTRYDCPIASCTWFHEAPSTLAVSGVAALYAPSPQADGLTDVLDRHFETHPWGLWVNEILFGRALAKVAGDREARIRDVIAELKDAASKSADPKPLNAVARQLNAALRGPV